MKITKRKIAELARILKIFKSYFLHTLQCWKNYTVEIIVIDVEEFNEEQSIDVIASNLESGV